MTTISPQTWAFTLGITAASQPLVSTGQLLSDTPDGKTLSVVRMYNGSPVGGSNIWYTRSSNVTPTSNMAGCFRLAPGEQEFWAAPGPAPNNPIRAVGDAACAALTIEAG